MIFPVGYAPFDGQVISGVAYFVRPTPPTARIDDSALQDDDCWYDSSTGRRWIRKGIYWVSEELYRYQWTINTATVSGNGGGSGDPIPFAKTVDPLIWLESFSMAGTYNAPQDASNYRTLNLVLFNTAGYVTVDSLNTIGLTGNHVVQHKAVSVATNARRIGLTIVTTGSPGTLTFWSANAFYREIYA